MNFNKTKLSNIFQKSGDVLKKKQEFTKNYNLFENYLKLFFGFHPYFLNTYIKTLKFW